MLKKFLIVASVAATSVVAFAPTASAFGRPRPSLTVIDGDHGRVVYDDGYDDGTCVYRRRFAGYDWYGHPVFRKVMRCF